MECHFDHVSYLCYININWKSKFKIDYGNFLGNKTVPLVSFEVPYLAGQ